MNRTVSTLIGLTAIRTWALLALIAAKDIVLRRGPKAAEAASAAA